MKRFLLLIFIVFALISCSEQGTEKGNTAPNTPTKIGDSELVNALVGTWESVSLEITMPSWDGGDSTGYITADASNWEEVMQIKPVKTVFESDYTYYAEYYDLNGQLIRRPSGTWEVRGNQLTYKEEVPVMATFYQQVEKISDTQFRFTFQMDYDQDGLEDDRGIGISRKVN